MLLLQRNGFAVTRRLTRIRNNLHHFSSDATTTSATYAFDRPLKRLQRANAARSTNIWSDDPDAVFYDYFRDEVARRLVDRLDDIRRDEGFPLALDLGSGPGYVHRAICADDFIQGDGKGGIGGVRKLVQVDSCTEMLQRDAHLSFEGSDRCSTYRLQADEEGKLAFPDGTFDLVISSASMHWINDLPFMMKEVRRVLKPDGCFMFAMIGGTTLSELRASMVMAEQERDGGVSPHVGPFVELSDVGSLLQRAGFTLPTIDTDTIHLSFPNAAVLMEHLQRMGENNAGVLRRETTSLDTFLSTACIYDALFSVPELGEVEASVQVIYAIGWTPHVSQQVPLQRGSASHKMEDLVQHTYSDKAK